MDADATYRRFAKYYDLYAGDFDADLATYKSFCHPDHKILEVGCGTGRVLQSLLQDGFAVTGIDVSQEMLDLAREKLPAFFQQGSLRLYRHDFREQPFPEKYERAFVTFYTFNYVLDCPETFLRHLSQSLTEEALLVMDLFYPKTLLHQELDNVWTTHELKKNGRVITLKDKRTLAGNLEE